MTESKMENVIRLRSKEFRRDKGVKWSRINKYLPFKWIPIGYEVNNNSYAYDIFENFNLSRSAGTTKNKQITISNEPIYPPQAETLNKKYTTNNPMTIITEPNVVLADAWFWEDNNYKRDYLLMEYNIPMPRYDSVLTVLWEEKR